MRYVYLHGFASGPRSRKAVAFQSALAKKGVTLEVPDLAQGDFEHLTISGQLAVVERQLAGEPACLIGSSMGGYLASLYAASHREVDRLVLLAPAFGFSTRWQELLGPEQLRAWGQTGTIEVFHYGQNALCPLDYGLHEDALRFPALPDFPQAAHIYHGIHDAVVPVSLSRECVRQHQLCQLTEFDSDHELLNVLDQITECAVPFLNRDLA